MRDDYVGNTFFDPTASAFLSPTLSRLTTTSTTKPLAIPLAGQASAVGSTAARVSQDSGKLPSTQPLPSARSDPIQCTGGASPDSSCAGIGFGASRPPGDPGLSVKEGMECEADIGKAKNVSGGALGPHWVDALKRKERPVGAGVDQRTSSRVECFARRLFTAHIFTGLADEAGSNYRGRT